MKIKLVYFSGTGSTKHVAETFRNELVSRNNTVETVSAGKQNQPSPDQYDLLIICHAVHAFNPPKPVIEWVEKQKDSAGTPAAVISVSGGGEITPNLACRVLLKRKLAEKNFNVVYEKMIVMPSNVIVPTKKALAYRLLNILPYKVSYCADEILSGNKNILQPGIGNRILSVIGRLEHRGAQYIGQRMKVKNTCQACGLCVKQCPVDNIRLADSRPGFSDRCTLCLQCIYGCRNKALEPAAGKFMVIPEGYDFKKMLEKKTDSADIDIEKEARGYIWSGVRRYLLNTQDIADPVYKPSA